MMARIVNICEVCSEIFAGGDAPKNNMSENLTEQYSIPIYSNGETNKGLYGYTNIARVTKPSITISARGTIGYTAIRNTPFTPIVRLITLTPIPELIDIKYLYYAAQNYKFDGSGTSIPQLTVPSLKKYSFPLPALDEQKNITLTLDNVCKLIAQKKEQLNLLDKLIKSRFVELFGDPMTNSRGYPLKKYGDLFELNAGGTPSKQKPEYWDNGTISWIGSNMCQNSVIYKNDGNYITEEGFNHSSARMFPVDTVLIALVGATIGKTALLKFETTTNQNVLGVRGIRESGFTPEFVFYYTQGIYSKFLNIGDGGFSMASKGFISELTIPIVDLSFQNEFANFVKEVDKSKFEVQQSLEKLETLKKSLMQKYFG